MEDVLEKLQRILDQQEVNWQLLLTFVSTMIVCLPEAQKTFLGNLTVKILKFGTPQTIVIIVLKIEKFDVTSH